MFGKFNMYGQIVTLNLVNLFLILRGGGGVGRAFYIRETSKHSVSAAVPRVSRSESERDTL